MKTYLRFLIISVFLLSSTSLFAQSSQKMVDVKQLSMEEAKENKRTVLELMTKKSDATLSTEDLKTINLEIYRRGYGHHLTEKEFTAIRKEAKALRNKVK